MEIVQIVVCLIAAVGIVLIVLRCGKMETLCHELKKKNGELEMALHNEMVQNRQENAIMMQNFREENFRQAAHFNEVILNRLNENFQSQMGQLGIFSEQTVSLTQMNERKLEQVRTTLERNLQQLQADNNRKLESIRETVDEKLNRTLEKRLGESFRLVSERLEIVHQGIGQMQTLAAGVGDLKRVLSNIKVRGIWGEIQLEKLLSEILTTEQYACNVATIPNSNERVEFAIRLPGRGEQSQIWLPIDAKFPQEDYQRLQDAYESSDNEAIDKCRKALALRIKEEARSIAQKYIQVPHTTEFGILFLPVESLYAEVLRIPGLCDEIMREYRVALTGPTTLAALLNSLQIGFRTLAIEQCSADVWKLLETVKQEFGKFGDLLEKTQKKLQEAGKSIEVAARKSRTIERKLKDVGQVKDSVDYEIEKKP